MKTRSNLYSSDIVHMENYDTNDSVDSVDSVDSNDNQITPSQDGSIFKASSLFYTIISTVIICIYESMLYICKNYIIETKIWIYLLWVCLHYVSAHIYVQYCTPVGIIGFIYSIFIGPTPICYALSWAIFNGNQSLFNMWSILGAICVQQLSFAKFKFSNTNSKLETNE